MKHYIDKSALVAEIEKWQDGISKGIYSIPLTGRDRADATFEYEILGKIKDFLNTLEVKEVDLEKEINEYICNNFFGSQILGFFANRTKEEPNDQDIALCAKYFFELGLKAKDWKKKEWKNALTDR